MNNLISLVDSQGFGQVTRINTPLSKVAVRHRYAFPGPWVAQLLAGLVTKTVKCALYSFFFVCSSPQIGYVS